MKKFVLFLAIISLISCKQEGPDEGKKKPEVKPDTADLAQTPVAGNLEVKSWTNRGAKAKGAEPIFLRLKNNSGEEIIVTDVKFKNPNTVLTVKDDLSDFKIAAGKGPFDLTLVIDTADTTGPVTLDEPFTVLYKEGGKDRFTSGEVKETFDWISDADVSKELKLVLTPEATAGAAPLGKAVYGFSVENQGKFPVLFDKRFFLKDDSGISNFFEIDKIKSTCLSKNDWENESTLEPGKKCSLWLIIPSVTRTNKFKLEYHVLGKSAEADFTIDVK